MANRTISLDSEAYERLKAARREGESYSDAVKRLIRPPVDVDELIRKIQALSEETMDAVGEELDRRRGTNDYTRPKKRRAS